MKVYSRELVTQPSCFYVDMPDVVEWREVFSFKRYDPGKSSSATWQETKNGHPLAKKRYVVEATYHETTFLKADSTQNLYEASTYQVV